MWAHLVRDLMTLSLEDKGAQESLVDIIKQLLIKQLFIFMVSQYKWK